MSGEDIVDTDVADRDSIELVNRAPSVKRKHLAVPVQALVIVRDYRGERLS